MAAVTKPMNLGARVAQALAGKPSEQPIGYKAKAADQPANATKIRSSANMAFTRQRQKGTPNRSYPVEVINKAKAKMGGNTSDSY